MNSSRYACPALLSLLFVPFAGSAAQSLEACRAIEDRLDRFDCYERLEVEPAAGSQRSRGEDAAEREAESSAGLPTAGDVARQADDKRRVEEDNSTGRVAESGTVPDDFGRRPGSGASRAVERDGRTELLGHVAALEERLPNTWMITLEGGEQWLQMASRPYRLRVGEEVRIYPTRWGSAYRLTSERLSGYIQVERVD